MQTDNAPRFNMTIGRSPVKFVWFRVAKCGTRSTLKLLREHVDEFDMEQSFKKLYKKKRLIGYYKFAVVRDPYTRIVSGWNDKIRLRNEGGPQFTETQIEKMADFGYFTEWLVDQRPRTVNIHFRRQSLLVPLDVDHIGHIENFDYDLRRILTNAGFHSIKDVPHRNRHKAPDLPSLFTPRVLKLLNEYYERDFERFSYLIQD